MTELKAVARNCDFLTWRCLQRPCEAAHVRQMPPIHIFFTSIPEFCLDSCAGSARAVRGPPPFYIHICDDACLRVRLHSERTTCANCTCSFAFACSRSPELPLCA